MKSYLYQVSIDTHKLLLENYIFNIRLTIVDIFFISFINSSCIVIIMIVQLLLLLWLLLPLLMHALWWLLLLGLRALAVVSAAVKTASAGTAFELRLWSFQ